MRKLLVLFPGVGYSTARPLLYYAKRMGQEKGYEVLELEYSQMPEHPFENLKETAKTKIGRNRQMCSDRQSFPHANRADA